MLFKSNLLALVGTEENPNFLPSNVVIWDEILCKANLELKFKTPIINLRLRKDLIFIATINCIYVYTLLDYRIIDVILTNHNPTGIFAISYSQELRVIASPHTVDGKVHLQFYG